MRIRNAFFLLIGIPSSFATSEEARRLGKLERQDWDIHAALGENAYPYSSSTSIPDFSPVGALVSDKGTLGTATLIAPNLVITAAHVLKNSFRNPMPSPENWEFIIYSDFESANIDYRFKIDEIIIHPYWIARQSEKNPLGDGDKIGVDLALLKLRKSVRGVFPANFRIRILRLRVKKFLFLDLGISWKVKTVNLIQIIHAEWLVLIFWIE